MHEAKHQSSLFPSFLTFSLPFYWAIIDSFLFILVKTSFFAYNVMLKKAALRIHGLCFSAFSRNTAWILDTRRNRKDVFMMPEILRIGLDIGSTTIKCVVLNEADKIIYSCYERHLSLIAQKTRELLTRLNNEVVHGAPVRLSISGSAGMGLALGSHISFVQEVYATKVAADMLMPGTDVIIELGGEDAKILFLQGTLEVRMNGSCAGGTGAFIDQMAVLLDVTPSELDELAQGAERIYTIASRCGVFAKSDIQPLLNEGARKEDVAASIFQAVVNQTIAGLAQGREVKGDVLFLGGPEGQASLTQCLQALGLAGSQPTELRITHFSEFVILRFLC